MRKTLLLLLLPVFCFSQDILENYPAGQTDYIGGNVQFYKDFQEILKAKNLKPCENKTENLTFKLVVYPDKTVKYVKDEDPKSVTDNKCTFDLTREVLKYLKAWNPATVNEKPVAAVTSFLIIPNELFGELPANYDPIKDLKMATYEGGINAYRKKVFQSINLSRFTFDGTFRLEVTFVVEKDGKISNIQLAQSSGLKEFDDMIINSIKSIRNKWTPGTIHNIPIRSRFRLPLAFSME